MRIDEKKSEQFDIAVIGGGVNGCGIARDASGRGQKVLLCEKGDLASGTSSASSKLIHGGLRYLEFYEFGLVKKSLVERERLLKNMPHISWPMRFILPHSKGMRPAWLLRMGLFLYDHLGGRELLAGSKTLDLRKDAAGNPLKPDFAKGFEYSDCWVDDARLVVLTARDAADRGADIRTRTECVKARRKDGLWHLEMKNLATGEIELATAKILVNAAGPWVNTAVQEVLGSEPTEKLRLVRGSHIVTHKLYDHDRAYILQQPDGRIIFLLPYEQDFTLIGTTEADQQGDPGTATCSEEEKAYLLAAASEYLKTPVPPDAVVHSFAGVRPLVSGEEGTATKATRDYILHLDESTAPLLTVYGGKLTTHRLLAEEAMGRLRKWLPADRKRWTYRAALPGGDFYFEKRAELLADLKTRYPFLDGAVIERLFRGYGTHCVTILGEARDLSDLGQDFGGGLFECEVNWLITREWAQTTEDILWRRTKLGLHMKPEQTEALGVWLAAHSQQPTA